jgi:hypothetical protein
MLLCVAGGHFMHSETLALLSIQWLMLHIGSFIYRGFCRRNLAYFPLTVPSIGGCEMSMR